MKPNEGKEGRIGVIWVKLEKEIIYINRMSMLITCQFHYPAPFSPLSIHLLLRLLATLAMVEGLRGGGDENV